MLLGAPSRTSYSGTERASELLEIDELGQEGENAQADGHGKVMTGIAGQARGPRELAARTACFAVAPAGPASRTPQGRGVR